MGYRLNSKDIKTGKSYYGMKHYGYDDEQECGSYKYLIDLGKFTGNELFEYGCENRIDLNAEQFRKFIDMYIDEYLEDNASWKINPRKDEEFNEVYNSENDKELSWG